MHRCRNKIFWTTLHFALEVVLTKAVIPKPSSHVCPPYFPIIAIQVLFCTSSPSLLYPPPPCDPTPTMWYMSNPLLFLILVSSSLLSDAIISTILPINYTRLVCPWGSPSKRLRRSQIGLISNFPRVGPGFLETEVWALVKVGDRCSYCFFGKIEGLLC